MKRVYFFFLWLLFLCGYMCNNVIAQNDIIQDVKKSTLLQSDSNDNIFSLSVLKKNKIHFPFDEKQYQPLLFFLKVFDKNFFISDKIRKDVNNDGIDDYLIIFRNKEEKKYKLNEDREDVNEEAKYLLRHFLLLLGNSGNKYKLAVYSTAIIPCLGGSGLQFQDGSLVPSYLPPKIKSDTITIIVQKNLDNSIGGKGLIQMNIKFIYDKKSDKWFLRKCLSKYKGNCNDTRDDFETECRLTPKDFGEINLSDFNVYDFDAEKLGCNGMRLLRER